MVALPSRRVLNVPAIVDDATREAGAVDAERAISGYREAPVPDRLVTTRSLPEVIPADGGNGF